MLIKKKGNTGNHLKGVWFSWLLVSWWSVECYPLLVFFFFYSILDSLVWFSLGIRLVCLLFGLDGFQGFLMCDVKLDLELQLCSFVSYSWLNFYLVVSYEIFLSLYMGLSIPYPHFNNMHLFIKKKEFELKWTEK